MESEARKNNLSKVETIEQLRTTIDKLETIINQLNSTSVVNLPSPNAVEALITTTEELENAIVNLSSEAVVTDSEPTPIDEVEPEQLEATAIPLEEEQPVVEPETSASPTTIPQASAAKTPEPTEPETPNTVTNSKTQPPTKARKSKKKTNWIAIAIVALIVAIIPISLKYLSPGVTQKLFSGKTEETVARNITEETPVIARSLPDNNLPNNEEKPATPELEEQLKTIDIGELTLQQTEDIDRSKITENTKELTEEITEVAATDLTTEEIRDFDSKKSLAPEETKSTATIEPEIETSLTNKESEIIIASDSSELPEISQLESTSSSESLSNINEIAEQKLNLDIDNIPEKVLEQEDLLIVPENLVAQVTTKPLEVKKVIHDIKLTPEQNLIALLSDKILELSEKYQEDFVLSIEPNIANNIIVVRIADDWYQLESTEQDEIVANIFSRSQKLEFSKLEIKDRHNRLIARSPVVGQNMIIFRRDL